MPRPEDNWHSRHKDDRTFGQRAADVLRNGMGSWTFIGVFLLLMVAWMVLNERWVGWDPFPFILLNLMLSLLAGLQGAILLISAKRQDAISAALAQHDFETDVAAEEEIARLMEINRQQLALIEQLVAAQAERDRAADG
ncbi:DUF1003 domain-containing protein [Agrococcus carbonis]|uniref:DUF1003 domain-containing protein n=1 Tax=Agrococcus carbonis TaxID=684552 RepID=A0A1H1RE92_9MICO|nr:DUF1003 domain-containing protein [Agrococcus carbonis]SDS33866.1 Protein of unknown function [Agrococcus carbonis]